MFTFQKRLQKIFKKYDENVGVFVQTKEKLSNHRWSIYKYSIPIGFDKCIIMNLESEQEADNWINRLLRQPNNIYGPKPFKFNEDGSPNGWFGYRKVRSDGYLKNIYDNPRPLIKYI